MRNSIAKPTRGSQSDPQGQTYYPPVPQAHPEANMPQAFGFGFDDEDIEADPNEEPSVAREDGQPRDETPQATHPILHLVEEMV